MRSWRYGLALSATLLALSLILLLTRGLALGLDFEGGTAWDVPTSTVSVEGAARDVLRPLGEDSAKIQTIGSDILRGRPPSPTPRR